MYNDSFIRRERMKPRLNLEKTYSYTKTFKQWCESTSSYSIPNILKSRYAIIKCMWLIFFFSSLAYCMYSVTETFIQYYKHETTVKITHPYDSPIEFPAVTICNLNPYDYYNKENYQYINNIIKDNKLDEYYVQNNENINLSEKYDDSFIKLKRIIASNTTNNDSFRKMLGFKLESQMLLSCFYNMNPCNLSHFARFWSNDYGNCYTFNGGKDQNGNHLPTYKITRPGIDFGLHLELIVGRPDKEGILTEKNGLFIIIHNKSLPQNLFYDGINVATGFETYIPIKRTVYQKQHYPYSNCIKDLNEHKELSDYSRILYNYMKELDVVYYNQEFCYDLCFQDHLVNNCECSEYKIPTIKNKSYCKSSEEIKCFNNISKIFTANNFENLCKHSCPIQCERVVYDTNERTATYQTKYYYERLINRAKAYNSSLYKILYDSFQELNANGKSSDQIIELMKQNIVKIIVNYNQLTYTITDEIPSMTFDTLLGIIGGQLSLCIGISLFTVAELFELCLYLIIIFFKKKKAKSESMSNLNSNMKNQINKKSYRI